MNRTRILGGSTTGTVAKLGVWLAPQPVAAMKMAELWRFCLRSWVEAAGHPQTCDRPPIEGWTQRRVGAAEVFADAVGTRPPWRIPVGIVETPWRFHRGGEPPFGPFPAH